MYHYLFTVFFFLISNPGECSGGATANDIFDLTKKKRRKKQDRFNGMTEEEVIQRVLPDHLCDNLDIVIVSVNFIICYYFTQLI